MTKIDALYEAAQGAAADHECGRGGCACDTLALRSDLPQTVMALVEVYRAAQNFHALDRNKCSLCHAIEKVESL